jgi:hypothetical protein
MAQQAEADTLLSTMNSSMNETKSSKYEKVWRHPSSEGISSEEIVTIHVCDENRQISKDFCCQRNILVQNMKYFDRFLSHSETGYDDIDISVHCDVEIFEWLMLFIHEPDSPPSLEKSIVVSILISSDFLQMDSLVEICLQQISENLSEIIKLPIDLSCISEKLVNKLATMTHPKVLANTKDKKEKILSKLYKRRVELDFSRKSGTKGGSRTIAASLTCCRLCGFVYLDSYPSNLVCQAAAPIIDFRGRVTRRHMAVQGWSLTTYLKALHAGGMGWDSIYWHVWAACQIISVGDTMISALETWRYTFDGTCLIVKSRTTLDGEGVDGSTKKPSVAFASHPFSLSIEENSTADAPQYRMQATAFEDTSLTVTTTPTLNPARPLDVLSIEVLELMRTQAKYISGTLHKQLIENTAKAMVAAAKASEEVNTVNYADLLWGDVEGEVESSDVEMSRGRSRVTASSSQTKSQSLSRARMPAAIQPTLTLDALDFDKPSQKDLRSVSETRSRASSLGANRRNRAMSNSQTRGRGLTVPDDTPQGKNENGNGGLKKAASTRKDMIAGGAGASADTETEADWDLLRSLLPEVSRQVNINNGHYQGIWLAPHPLQIEPPSLIDARAVVHESNLSTAKKFEWEMDLLREYDEKRMNRYEQFLLSRRALPVAPVVDTSKSPTQKSASMPITRGSTGMPVSTPAKSSNGKPSGDSSGAVTSGAQDDRYALYNKLSGYFYKDKGRQPCRRSL